MKASAVSTITKSLPIALSVLVNYSLLATLGYINLFQKKDWEKIGGYDPKMTDGLEDWEFWINLLKNNTGNVTKIPYKAYFYRIKNNSRSADMGRKKADAMIRHIVEKHKDAYENIFGNYFALMNRVYHQDKKLQYYKQSKPHRVIDKILKIFYKISS